MKIIRPVPLVVILTSVFLSHYALADRGREIIDHAVKKGLGFGSTDTLQELVTTEPTGKINSRLLRVTRLEGIDSRADSILLVVKEPQVYKGNALLIQGMQGKDDKQWMYNRKKHKVRRIPPVDKLISFANSEFTFEDLGNWELDDYRYRFIQESEFNGLKTYEIEMTPVDPKSGYSRQVTWVDQHHLKVLKMDFYDKKGALEKTKYYENYRLYLDRYWRAHTLRMVSYKSNRQSAFIVQDKFKFNVGLTEKNFTTNELQRIR